jgi:hypothetical protein
MVAERPVRDGVFGIRKLRGEATELQLPQHLACKRKERE